MKEKLPLKSIHSQITCLIQKIFLLHALTNIHEYAVRCYSIISKSNVVKEIKYLNSNFDGDCLCIPTFGRQCVETIFFLSLIRHDSPPPIIKTLCFNKQVDLNQLSFGSMTISKLSRDREYLGYTCINVALYNRCDVCKHSAIKCST